MRLLVLGGTRFLGLCFVETALARGHAVTVLNRGLARPEPLPGVMNLRGDRDGGLAAALGDGEWDAVVDTSGYFPRIVRDSARYLRQRAGCYLFISTISVYADFSRPGLREDAELAATDQPEAEVTGGPLYGPLKALCEAEVRSEFGDQALIVRPGLIVGPHDPTDRFTYWPLRVAAGGQALAPDGPSAPTQFIDVRDLTEWAISLLEEGGRGTFHATGQAGAVDFGRLLAACASAAGDGAASLTWVPERFLLDHGVTPWTEVPLWVPAGRRGLVTVDVAKALGAGLRTRPLAETVGDTLAWALGRPTTSLRAGLTKDREADLLTAWQRRQ